MQSGNRNYYPERVHLMVWLTSTWLSSLTNLEMGPGFNLVNLVVDCTLLQQQMKSIISQISCMVQIKMLSQNSLDNVMFIRLTSKSI